MNESESKAASIIYNPVVRVSILIIVLLIAIILFLVGSVNSSSNRAIKPLVATTTPAALRIDSEAERVDFADLEADPLQFRNQRIEVSGLFTHITLPDCLPYSGPQTKWGLINGTLQMNALGYENIIRTLPNQIDMRCSGDLAFLCWTSGMW